MKSALLVVDIQNDFLPGGALGVAGGDQVVAVANAAMAHFEIVVATQDWHPADHGSFASRYPGKSPGELIELHGITQVLWPDHCVQDSHGARFAPDLDTTAVHAIFPKGTHRAVDSYSGFFDNSRRHETGLAAWLRGQGVTRVYLLGLATDYCVRFTALDALAEGFATEVILSGCRGVNLKPGDADAAVREIKARGAVIHADLDTAVRAKQGLDLKQGR
jgi:nicotinamidase/pyrazinamidase